MRIAPEGVLLVMRARAPLGGIQIMTNNETGQESHYDNQAPSAEPTLNDPAALGQAEPVRSHRMWRARSVLVVGAVGAVVIASSAVGIALSAHSTSLDSQALGGNSANSRATGTGQGQLGQGATGNQGGSATLIPRRGNGSSFGSPHTSTSTNATAATASQSIGVVLINTQLKYQNAEAAGTGIVLTSTGEILTNNHVVNGATSISVTIASTGKTYHARVVGTDVTSDIAVLSLDGASGLKIAPLGSSGGTALGDAITAVGNAGGTGTLSAATGKIAAVNQTITATGEGGSDAETLHGLIETNADVVAGDSGGPLYNSAGRVVGIDTAASSGTARTTGYAIPLSTALSLARQIESGKASSTITIGYPAFFGVEIANDSTGATAGGQSDQTANGATGTGTTSTGAPAAGATVAGATVAGVVDSTPAASAGLVAGDTITAVDSTAITSAGQLTSVLRAHHPGDSVTINWTDAAGAAHSASVVLIAGAAN